MSTESAFSRIDSALKEYYRRYRDPENHDGNEEEDEDGEFLRGMKHHQFDENEIEDEFELGDDADPNECAYVDVLHHFPIPSYIPDAKHASFKFYILRYIYVHSACPSKADIQRIANELIDKPKSLRIDLLIPTEDERWADDEYSERYKESARDMEIISLITNSNASPKHPEAALIRLVSIFNGNMVQLMNDLMVRAMLNSLMKHDIVNDNAFRNIFLQFVSDEMPHYRYIYEKLPEYIRTGLDTMAIPRWYGYTGYHHIMNDVSSETEEKKVHADDPTLPYHAAKVQSIFGAFMAYTPHVLLLCKAVHCMMILILKSHTSRMDHVSEDIDYYINEFRKLFEAVDHNRIRDGVIVSLVMEVSTDGSITYKGPYYDEKTQRVSMTSRQFAERIRAKSKFGNTKDIGIAVHKFEHSIQCNLHNIPSSCVLRIEPRDFSTWFPRLFKHGSDTSFNERFYYHLRSYHNVLRWSEWDPYYEEKLMKLMRITMNSNPKVFKIIFGIERIRTESFRVHESFKLNLFNEQSMTKELCDVMESFGGMRKSICYLNVSTELQRPQMKQFTVVTDGNTRWVLSFINNGLQNAKMECVYTSIEPSTRHPSQWILYRLFTGKQIFKTYAILSDELPRMTDTLQHLKEQYVMRMPPWLLKVQHFVQVWNQKKNVKPLDYDTLQRIFVENAIHENYRNDHVVRCLWKFFKNNDYSVSRAAVAGIWNAMDPTAKRSDLKEESENSHDIEDESEDDIGEQLDELNAILKPNDTQRNWEQITVSKYVTTELLPNGNIDEPIRNYYDFLRQWLCLYGAQVISKYTDTNGVVITITNYNLHRNREEMYVVKEGTRHYLKTASELPTTPSLPSRPAIIWNDEKWKDIIKSIFKGCTKWIEDTKWDALRVIGAQKTPISSICTYTVCEFKKQIKRAIGDKDIRLEAVPRFDDDLCAWLIDWVWVSEIECCIVPNERCVRDIGIAVIAMDGVLHPHALYLTIYDQQRLISFEADQNRDGFREMCGLRIGNVIKDQKEKPKLL